MNQYNMYFKKIEGEDVSSMMERQDACRRTITEGGCRYRVTFERGRKVGIFDYEGIKTYSIEWVRLQNGGYHFLYNKENVGLTHNEPTMVSFLDKLFE